jgi:dTDP-4-dehydrorhamnose 3,5-epimerase-like enzyme
VRERDFAEWIWVPPGFAHGTLLPEDTTIEYFCTASWNPAAESAISPIAADFDWSLCDAALTKLFADVVAEGVLMTEKDRFAPSLTDWQADPRSALVTG